jgi:hypothetical protein
VVVPKVVESLGEVIDDVILNGGLDDHVFDVGFNVLPIWDSKHFCMAFW